MLIDTFILCAVCAAGAFPGQDAYLAGHAAEAARDSEKAIASYEACARKDPALEAYARIRVGLCHLRNADLAAAEGAFRAVLKDYIEGPWAPMARVHLARTLRRQKKHAEAAPLSKDVLAVTPRPWWMDKYAWDSGENLLGHPLTRRAGFAFFREVAETTGWVGPRRDAAMKLLKSPSSVDRASAVLGLLRSGAYAEAEKALLATTAKLTGPDGRLISMRDVKTLLFQSASKGGKAPKEWKRLAKANDGNIWLRLWLIYSMRKQAHQKKRQHAAEDKEEPGA